MKGSIRLSIENDTFTRHIMAVILVLFIAIIGIFSAVSFLATQEDLSSNFQASQRQSEEGLASSLVLVDKGLALFDALPDAAMREALEEARRAYVDADNDPGKVDYTALQARLQGSFDGTIEFYVINETGVIEYSTYQNDIGVDFKRWPEYYARYTDIRLGDAFSADRSTFGTQGVLRKFAYLPMPDHRSVVQMSLASPEFHAIREEFSYQMALQQCMHINPDIVEIRLFDRMPRYRCNATSGFFPSDYVPGADVVALVNRAFSTEMPQEISVPADETQIRYIYLDMPDSECVSSAHMDLVAQITYSQHALNLAIAEQLLYHVIIALVAILLGGVVAFGASRYVSRPVTMLAEDVKTIADGDLDHPIRTPWNGEIRALSRNIAYLVARLKDNLAAVGEYSDHLEQIINERTARLQATNVDLNRYLDLLKYSTRNASAEIQSYLTLQRASLESADTSFLDAALATARRTEKTIATIYALRRESMFGESPRLHPVDLHDAIEDALRDHHASVRFTGVSVMVYADELLGLAVFTLIQFCTRIHDDGAISIAIDEKEGTAGVRITLSVQESTPSQTIDISDQWLSRHPEFEIARLILQRYGSDLHVGIGSDPGDLLSIAFTLETASQLP
ncbi:MAG TPA: HAMP domain-containing protein [Methanoculleus sp.]|nr:HAMP domain-containing protein [Methanoculleus sp.]